jgi:D-3-phosphoglycerate dehydrogenase
MYKVLVSDPLAKEGIARLQAAAEAGAAIQVDIKTGLPKAELLNLISEYDALVVRSETKVTAEVLKAATRLKVVARAGVGVDNIDVDAATERGVIVVNTPSGNTIAATEQAFLLMMATARKLAQANSSLKGGKWERKQFVGIQLFDKTLGIIGLGRIGTEIARRAIAFGMHPIAYDPFVAANYAEKFGIEMTTLDEIYRRADFITVHSPMLPETLHMINDQAFAKMKDGVRIINAARGGIIDEDALYRALESGKVAAAGLDVFEQEPPPADYPLLQLPTVVVTPHLGASSEEAQIKVAIDAADSIVAALNGELVANAVNLPGLSREALAGLKPYLTLADKLGRLATSLADGPLEKVEVWFEGEVVPNHARLLVMSALQGLLYNSADEQVNLVNARTIANRRGLEVTEHQNSRPGQFSGLTITLKVQSRQLNQTGAIGLSSFSGTLINGEPRIVRINNYPVDVEPVGYLLVSRHIDKPGIIGKVGTALGNGGINIASMEVGRRASGGEAVMILAVDNPVAQSLIEDISKVDGVENLRFVSLGNT